MTQLGRLYTNKHDVAFSFLQQDEQLALSFADALQPLTSFVYSCKQEELAGTDGQESFRAAFRYDSRLNVILLRAGWGMTPWTRVEQTAIQERCLHDGWDALLAIKLDGERPPIWLPEMRIYLDLQAFSFDQAVGAIKRQVQTLGGEVRPMTATQTAVLVAKAAAFREESKTFFWTREGILEGDNAVRSLFDQLAMNAEMAAKEHGKWNMAHGFRSPCNGVIRLGRGSVRVTWQRSGNTCENAELLFEFFRGEISTPQEVAEGRQVEDIFDKPRRQQKISLTVHRHPTLGICWTDGTKVYSSDEIGGTILNALVHAAASDRR